MQIPALTDVYCGAAPYLAAPQYGKSFTYTGGLKSLNFWFQWWNRELLFHYSLFGLNRPFIISNIIWNVFSPFQWAVSSRSEQDPAGVLSMERVGWSGITLSIHLGLFCFSIAVKYHVELSNRNIDFYFFLTLSEMPVKWSRSRKILDSEINRNLILATTFEGELIIQGKANRRGKKNKRHQLYLHIPFPYLHIKKSCVWNSKQIYLFILTWSSLINIWAHFYKCSLIPHCRVKAVLSRIPRDEGLRRGETKWLINDQTSLW